jgi:hypothetical protein
MSRTGSGVAAGDIADRISRALPMIRPVSRQMV